MKPVIIIAIAFVLLIPLPIFAQQAPPIDLPIKKYENMDSVLEQIYDMHAQGQDFQSLMRTSGLSEVNKIRVEIILEENDSQLPNDWGIEEELRYQNRIQALVPYSKLVDISNLDNVKFVGQSMNDPPTVTSQGVGVMNADDVHTGGNTGQGIKVVVIENGFDITDPEISGNIVEILDQVFIILLSPDSFAFLIFRVSRSSTNGPFFKDLPTL